MVFNTVLEVFRGILGDFFLGSFFLDNFFSDNSFYNLPFFNTQFLYSGVPTLNPFFEKVFFLHLSPYSKFNLKKFNSSLSILWDLIILFCFSIICCLLIISIWLFESWLFKFSFSALILLVIWLLISFSFSSNSDFCVWEHLIFVPILRSCII